MPHIIVRSYLLLHLEREHFQNDVCCAHDFQMSLDCPNLLEIFFILTQLSKIIHCSSGSSKTSLKTMFTCTTIALLVTLPLCKLLNSASRYRKCFPTAWQVGKQNSANFSGPLREPNWQQQSGKNKRKKPQTEIGATFSRCNSKQERTIVWGIDSTFLVGTRDSTPCVGWSVCR